MQNITIKEQIRKKVTRSGNGGAVWVPKNWLGEEIIVTRLEQPKFSLQEEIINMLLPHIKDISGIFLYGSYAKGEETSSSDIDILVLSKNKFNIENTKRLDIDILEIEKIKEIIQKNPFIYTIINESKPILNSYLLEQLKTIQLNPKDLKEFIKWYKITTKDSIKSIKELIELDKLDSEYIRSYSIIYSLILRLRGVYLIHCLLRNKAFSNKLFKKWVLEYIPDHEYMRMYNVYRCLRNTKKTTTKIETRYATLLLNMLNEEVKKLNGK